jgi:hypothetical protein
MARSAYIDAGPSVSPIGVAPTGEVYWHERGHTADGGMLSWWVWSATPHTHSARRQMRLNDIEPDILEQIGPVTAAVYTKDYPQEDEAPWADIALAAGETFVDFRAEGRFVSVKFSGSAVPSFARLGRVSFDVIQTGQR